MDRMAIFKNVLGNRIPGQLVIQMTDRCNARCPQCGMRVIEPFKRSTLSSENIRRLIDAAAEKKFQAVSFTGGEPLIFRDELLGHIRYAGRAGIPYIRTGTNGFVFRDPHLPGFKKRVYQLAEDLAATPLRNFWISIDSAFDPVHEQMRGFRGIVKGIEKALPVFHEMGLYPSANLGINRNLHGVATRMLRRDRFDTQRDYLDAFYTGFYAGFDRFYQRVVDMGFTMANTCYPMSIDRAEQEKGLSAVYAASAAEDVVRFDAAEKEMLFGALSRSVRKWRSKIRIFSPLCAIDALIHQYRWPQNGHKPVGCRGGIDFFFVNAADGNTYPCGYRGNENLGKLWELDLSELKERIHSEACSRCDWECFRDPTELMSPLLQAFTSPRELAGRLLKKDRSIGLWLQDILYYRACGLFNGRKPPEYTRMASYKNLIDC